MVVSLLDLHKMLAYKSWYGKGSPMMSPKTWQLMSMKQREVKGNPPHGFDVFTASHLKKTITIWVWSFYDLFALEEKCNHCILEVLYSYIEKSWQITTTSGANSGTGRHPCKRELVKKDKIIYNTQFWCATRNTQIRRRICDEKALQNCNKKEEEEETQQPAKQTGFSSCASSSDKALPSIMMLKKRLHLKTSCRSRKTQRVHLSFTAPHVKGKPVTPVSGRTPAFTPKIYLSTNPSTQSILSKNATQKPYFFSLST